MQWRAICTKMCEMRRRCCCHGTRSILTPHPTWDWSHTDTLTLVTTHPNYEIGYSQSQLHSVLPFIGSLSFTVYELSLDSSNLSLQHAIAEVTDESSNDTVYMLELISRKTSRHMINRFYKITSPRKSRQAPSD